MLIELWWIELAGRRAPTSQKPEWQYDHISCTGQQISQPPCTGLQNGYIWPRCSLVDLGVLLLRWIPSHRSLKENVEVSIDDSITMWKESHQYHHNQTFLHLLMKQSSVRKSSIWWWSFFHRVDVLKPAQVSIGTGVACRWRWCWGWCQKYRI